MCSLVNSQAEIVLAGRQEKHRRPEENVEGRDKGLDRGRGFVQSRDTTQLHTIRSVLL